MQVEIKGKVIELRHSIKGLIMFEAVKKNYSDGGNLFDFAALVWCFLRAEIERTGVELNLSLEDFIDWLDADSSHYPDCVKWLEQTQSSQTELLDSEKKSQVM